MVEVAVVVVVVVVILVIVVIIIVPVPTWSWDVQNASRNARRRWLTYPAGEGRAALKRAMPQKTFRRATTSPPALHVLWESYENREAQMPIPANGGGQETMGDISPGLVAYASDGRDKGCLQGTPRPSGGGVGGVGGNNRSGVRDLYKENGRSSSSPLLLLL